jgi:hypothetical protein
MEMQLNISCPKEEVTTYIFWDYPKLDFFYKNIHGPNKDKNKIKKNFFWDSHN